MSHFSVGVIVKNLNDLSKALEPYGEEAEDFFEKNFYMTKHEAIRQYLDNPNAENINKEDIDAVWPLVKDYFGINENNVEGNNIYLYYNPNAKWDWYEIGGRWSKSLRVSKKAEYYIEPFVALSDKDEKAQTGGKFRWADAAPLKEILWDRMNTITGEKRKELSVFWDEYVGTNSTDEIRKKYFNFYKPEYYIQKYGTKSEFLRRSSLFLTHSLYIEPEGEWIEPGEVGWFGSDSSTLESAQAYEKQFYKIMHDPKYQDYWLVIVDCHI